MSRDASEGLFKVLNNTNINLWGKAFCKIAEAKVLTSLLSSDHRYIAYSVKGWRNEPVEGIPSEPIMVRDDVVFFTRIPKAVYNVYQIDEICRTHFLSEAIYLKSNDSNKLCVLNLSVAPTKGLGYSFFAVNSSVPIASAKRFWHVEQYESSGILPIELTGSYSAAIMADNQFNQFDVMYDNDFDWFKAHRAALVSPADFAAQRMYAIES
jgi:hypothetical protein